MFETKQFEIEVLITERGDETRADAVLRGNDVRRLHGVGRARRNPRDRSVPEIGDELAAARALSHLAHQLLDAAAADVESFTREPADLVL